MKLYENSGEPSLTNLKGQLWRNEAPAWIYTGLTGRAFALLGLPNPGETERPTVARHTDDGFTHVLPGYIFDGSSVPLLGRWLDYRTNAWPGCFHDIWYEGGRAGKLVEKVDREPGDAVYASMLGYFGAWGITEVGCYRGLRVFGASAFRRAPDYEQRVTRSTRKAA